MASAGCRRDELLCALHGSPLKMSSRALSTLRVTDLTQDNGQTWWDALSPDLITKVRAYVYRRRNAGQPFLDWRPDIGPYASNDA